MPNKQIKKRRLNIKKLLILLLVVYLFGYGAYYVYKEPIRNIIITGNTLVSDAEIIQAAGIKNYPSIFGIKRKSLTNKIKKLTLIEDVIIKKDLKFRLIIHVKEAKVLFINKHTGKLILSNGESIDNDYSYTGIPTLINFTPEDILKEFTEKIGIVDYGILSLISEIAYSPSFSKEGTPIDNTRFILYMNDGNEVYTNISKCENLSHYREIYAGINGQKGILYLDSGNYKNFSFRTYESLINDELQ